MSYINKLANLKVGQSIPRWQLTDCKDSHQYRSKDYGVHQDRTRAVYMYALYKFPERKFKLSKEFVTREEDNTIESEKIKSEEIKFEEANFRVDSTGWREQKRKVDGKATRIKVSPKTAEYPEGEITEIVEGPFAGEQYFTWDAAMVETAKAGKRMPTKEEWEKLMRAGKTDNIFLPGYRRGISGTYHDQGSYGYYWSSSLGGYYAYFNSSSSGGYPARLLKQPIRILHWLKFLLLLLRLSGDYLASNGSRVYGFSVRCIQ